ncbi:hypothetical protein [Acetonema longum]|uniref:DUF2007 domain-containing protein n=1 Tax=Acetonema longum DSM 6540 TaxID=1009370 RepID=F7NQ70_9FIRM|nr:hypothetical protein [Acetonema longum]EGO61829.1 hypothetical protein ALO_21354 [Acetonema longum DSM 6540]
MWTVVYIAANRLQSDNIKKLLCREGILADSRPAGVSMLGDGLYEILVLESEAEEATSVLCHNITGV